jgi:hypothetical protein
MKRLVSNTVRVVSLCAATAIRALIVTAHDMDLADLGAREVIASMPMTVAATEPAHRDAASPAR